MPTAVPTGTGIAGFMSAGAGSTTHAARDDLWVQDRVGHDHGPPVRPTGERVVSFHLQDRFDADGTEVHVRLRERRRPEASDADGEPEGTDEDRSSHGGSERGEALERAIDHSDSLVLRDPPRLTRRRGVDNRGLHLTAPGLDRGTCRVPWL